MKKITLLFICLCATFALAQHKPKMPIEADKLCCGCTAEINGECVGYHCGLCPLFAPRVASRVSLLPDELAPFTGTDLATPRCEKLETGKKANGGGRTKETR